MRSKPENQEGQLASEENEQETGNEGEVRVADKRRIIVIENETVDAVSEKPDGAAAENEKLQAKLKEADEKRVEAERQVRDISERFRQAQAQLKAETEEQRARMQRLFEQKLEAARGDLVASLLD